MYWCNFDGKNDYSLYGNPRLCTTTALILSISAVIQPYCASNHLGSIFEIITGGVFKATYHRVLDIATERYSCPFFFEPSYYTHVPLDLMD